VDGDAFEVVCRKMAPQPDKVLPVEEPQPA
jgi:hypothetical protein